ncbi:peptide ABC transporter substrate-binding protein [Clostridiales bacterium COT073_COT-073]|nr:peptide ABC transporter substrate-binding protein [Clostridiales bacterium COT073_COT-073]
MKGTMRKWLGLGLAVIMLISLSGCGPTKEQKPADTGQPAETGKPADTPAKEEKPGNTEAAPSAEQVLKISIRNEPGALDPWFNNNGEASSIMVALHEPLLRPDGENGEKSKPALLEEYTYNADKTVHTLKLRKGAKWQDGSEVTAEDIVYSFQRALDGTLASEKAYQYYEILNAEAVFKGEKKPEELGVKQLDGQTIEITTTLPCDYFEEMLKSSGMAPVQKKAAEEHKDLYGSEVEKIVASGPFKLTEWTHKNSMVLERNENYWDADNVSLNKIEITITNDANSIIGMYQNQELSLMRLGSDLLEKYKDAKGFSTHKRLKVTFIEFNPRNEFLSNIKIREALSIAFDRKQFAGKIMKNEKLAAYGLVPYGVKGEKDGDFREQQGDMVVDSATDPAALERAKKLLEEGLKELGKDKAELEKGFVIQCLEFGKLQAQAIQNMWKESLGIEIPVTVLEFNIILPMLQKGTFDCVIGGGQDSPYRDPQGFMEFIYAEGKWDNQEFKQLVEKAHNQVGDERIASWKKIEKMVLDNFIYIPQVYAENNWVVQDNVEGIHIYPCGYEFDYKDVKIMK